MEPASPFLLVPTCSCFPEHRCHGNQKWKAETCGLTTYCIRVPLPKTQHLLAHRFLPPEFPGISQGRVFWVYIPPPLPNLLPTAIPTMTSPQGAAERRDLRKRKSRTWVVSYTKVRRQEDVRPVRGQWDLRLSVFGKEMTSKVTPRTSSLQPGAGTLQCKQLLGGG